METLVNYLENFFIEQGFERNYCLALSGGLDSTVLLHLLVNLRSMHPLKLHAVHVHHGLSINADSWTLHCKNLCEKFSVPFSVYHIDAIASVGESPEEVARENRYHIFSNIISTNDVLITAHQQDDQAETLLLQLMRGAGPKGLAAMSAIKKFGNGFHARPLLQFTREQLRYYAEQNRLQWIEDESNFNKNFTRNFIRHDVLALLKSRWPNITTTLARVANHCANTQTVLENYIQHDLKYCAGSKPDTLSVSKLREFDDVRQAHIVRMWLANRHIPIPSSIKMQHILSDVVQVDVDKMPHLIWDEVELRRHRDDLYVMPCLTAHSSQETYAWDFKAPLLFSNGNTLTAVLAREENRLRTNLQDITVRFRQGGETCFLRNHHHELKKLFQEWDVPTWLRDRIPLIFVKDELVAVVGFWIHEKFAAGKNEWGFILRSESEGTSSPRKRGSPKRFPLSRE